MQSEIGPLNTQFGRQGKIRFGGIDMNQTYTAVVKQDDQWWIGWNPFESPLVKRSR
jgi:hypothetical protein